MFVFKSTHEALLADAQRRLENECLAYERLIETYKSQISDLRQLVFPKTLSTPAPMALEADAVLTGSDKPFEVSEEEHNKLLNDAREVDLLFSGNYSEDLLN